MERDYSLLAEGLKQSFEQNNYAVTNAPLQGDDFRLLLVLYGNDRPSIEVFKEKNSSLLIYATAINLGRKKLEKLSGLPLEKQQELRKNLEDLHKTLKVDFFEIEDDGNDYSISIECVTNLDNFTLESIGECMDNLNDSANLIWDVLNRFFA